jgi:hypothetical protein
MASINGTVYRSSEDKIFGMIIAKYNKIDLFLQESRFLFSLCVFLQYIMSGITMISTDIKQIIYIFFEREIIIDYQRQLKGLLKSQPHLYFKKLSLSSISLKGGQWRRGYYSNDENSINNKYKKVCRFFITKCRR